MGTWGPGIFADDTTCDVRASYRRALRAGVAGPQATDQIIRDDTGGPDTFDTHGRVWLGLAATQLQLGRLEDRVKAKALEIIDSGPTSQRGGRRTSRHDGFDGRPSSGCGGGGSARSGHRCDSRRRGGRTAP